MRKVKSILAAVRRKRPILVAGLLRKGWSTFSAGFEPRIVGSESLGPDWPVRAGYGAVMVCFTLLEVTAV
jgi:hypothetical protein